MSENLNLFTSTQDVIKEALNKLGYDEAMYELLKEPLRMLHVRIPVKMDDGFYKNIYGLTVLSIMMLWVPQRAVSVFIPV